MCRLFSVRTEPLASGPARPYPVASMDRQPPRSTSREIELYIRTIYSLLRSTGDVRLRGMEEAHIYSNSSLHTGARDMEPDIAAFAYSAGRLPECMPAIRRVVLGQSFDQFERAGFDIAGWKEVRARGRRRAMRWEVDTLAVIITSVSDIDDFVPIVTAYQIEWNKMHSALHGDDATPESLDLEEKDLNRLYTALGPNWRDAFERLRAQVCDLSIRLLSGSFNEYQRSAKRWWRAIEPTYAARTQRELSRRPVYFVSSNTHSLVNLLGGYARAHREQIIEFAHERDPEGLSSRLQEAIEERDEASLCNSLYYLLRSFLHRDGGGATIPERLKTVQAFDAESGIDFVPRPGHVDVGAQVFSIASLRPQRFDPRLKMDGLERLKKSNAVIINIDYPLGMAAYHLLSSLAQGVADIRGVYVMGKAATLNGRVGDVGILKAVYDEHSKNTYLLKNCFSASDLQDYMQEGTVLDNQKAVTVRGAYLQNRQYMGVFYDEGYSLMEMEAGPYLSAIYEILNPIRHPDDEIVNLSHSVPFDVGFLHYASDTPYSRRQSLLSKSLSFFGVESTYACAIAIVQRILRQELDYLRDH